MGIGEFLGVLYTLRMPEKTSAKSQDTKADETLRRRLAEFVEKHGEKKAIDLLETPRQTFARVIAGLSVRRATLAFVVAQLDKLEPVDTSDASKETDHGHE